MSIATPWVTGCCVAAALAACAPPSESEVDAAPDETALYRVGEGECLSAIADQLSFPGGWRALAKANELRGDAIRAGAALRVPVAYLRDAGLDPYRDFGLEPFHRPIAREPLIACRDEVAHGECATVGDTRLCVEAPETSELAAVHEPDDDDDCVDLVDGAIDCASDGGRVLVAYRGGVRREVVALPVRGGFEVEAHAVDLDGDGRTEIVAAIPIELHNHEGWQSVRAVVLDDRGALAASFDVAQWGEGSLVEAASGGCDVLATSWEWVRHPLDGEGMYFVGRRLGWQDGAVVPRAGEVMRRFRTYFHVTCEACDGFGPQTPAAWLSGPEASWWPELGDGTPARDSERGTIVGAELVEGAVAFDVQLGDRRVHFDPTASAYDDWRPPDVVPLAWLRLGESGATLPDMFVPGDLTRWIGRTATAIETGDDGSDSPSHTLWID